jgi:hypothetical protein
VERMAHEEVFYDTIRIAFDAQTAAVFTAADLHFQCRTMLLRTTTYFHSLELYGGKNLRQAIDHLQYLERMPRENVRADVLRVETGEARDWPCAYRNLMDLLLSAGDKFNVAQLPAFMCGLENYQAMFDGTAFNPIRRIELGTADIDSDGWQLDAPREELVKMGGVPLEEDTNGNAQGGVKGGEKRMRLEPETNGERVQVWEFPGGLRATIHYKLDECREGEPSGTELIILQFPANME